MVAMDFDCILVRYGEIGLKRGNRAFFEGKLARNIRWCLRQSEATFKDVKRIEGRFCVTTKDPKALEAIGKVFGIVSYSPAKMVPPELDEVSEYAAKLASRLKPASFRITAHRLDKRVKTTSQEMNELVGAKVVEKTKTRVDLKNPELNIGLDSTKDHTYVYTQTFPGLGGLPVGASARVICLLSGGIDSPVAAWTMMKRGCEVTLVHYMHEEGKRIPPKIGNLYKKLQTYGPGVKLMIVPAAALEREIIMKVPAKRRIVVLRRMFLKAAVNIMLDEKAHAIVTGDNVGQVASQTVENMEATQAGIDALILRPLAGWDKQEIINLAKKIGTFGESTTEYVDCCSFLVPQHPETKADKEEIQKTEKTLDPAVLDTMLDGMMRFDAVK